MHICGIRRLWVNMHAKNEFRIKYLFQIFLIINFANRNIVEENLRMSGLTNLSPRKNFLCPL